MSVLLYGVTDADANPTPGDGLEGRPLRTLPHEDLKAIVSDVESAPQITDEASVWAYEAVVERSMREGPVLPARFGTTAEDDGEIVAMLTERHRDLQRAIEAVRGAVEFAVRVPETEPDTAPETPAEDEDRPGTAYMRRLVAEDGVLLDQGKGLAPLIRAHARRGRGSHACLVDVADAEAFRARTAELGLTVTGPWPPYSFVGAAA